MTSPQQHDDPLGEARGQVLQALAVLTTVGEAAARFAVAGAHNRAAQAERQTKAAQVAATARDHADRIAASARAEQDQAARQLMDKALNEQWLGQAGIADAAELWRTAAMYASTGDTQARQAMRLAENRLRQLNPILMDAYIKHRASGMNLAEAMRAAAQDVWQHEARAHNASPARAHGNIGDPNPELRANGPAIGAVPDPDGLRMVNDLEAATRAEVARLADGVDPELLDRLQRQWRSAGHAPAADAASLLASSPRQLRAASHLTGPVTGTANIRRGINYASNDTRPSATLGHDTADAPVRTGLAGYELAAQGLDRAAEKVWASQAAGEHLTGLADQQQRAGTLQQGIGDVPGTPIDVPGTPIDEHRDAMRTGRLHHRGAEEDQAAADQQRRLGRAFQPLGSVQATVSAGPAAPKGTPTPRKGRSR